MGPYGSTGVSYTGIRGETGYTYQDRLGRTYQQEKDMYKKELERQEVMYGRHREAARQYDSMLWKPEILENPSISGVSTRQAGIIGSTQIVQTQEKTDNVVVKLKRRRVPRIFRYLLWTLVIVLAWKLVSNAEIITITLFNLFTK